MTGREDREPYRDLEERYEQAYQILSDLVESIHEAEHVGDIDTDAAEEFLHYEA